MKDLNKILDIINKENQNLDSDLVNTKTGFISRIINTPKYTHGIDMNSDRIVSTGFNHLNIYVSKNKEAAENIKTKIVSCEMQNINLEKRTKYIVYFIALLALTGIFPTQGIFKDIVDPYLFQYHIIVSLILACTLVERINSSFVIAKNKVFISILNKVKND